MFIKEVQILGFKSFPEKTVIKFMPGITAIVGPNGCGKTNIFDAIRWVLGEQSLSKIRCSKAEELIYTGNSTSRGFAEVRIVFENRKSIPEMPEEIEIKRRFYLSGEGEFWINRNECRLKDIEQLVRRGSGGAGRIYVLFDREALLEIINGKLPMFIEAVAGIKFFKEKKKEAERKLESTVKDLERLEDILREKRRFLYYLAREKGKLMRAKELKNEIFTYKIKVLNAFKEKEKELKKEKDSIAQRLKNIRDRLDEIIKKQEEEKQAFMSFSQNMQRLFKEKEKIAGELERKTFLHQEQKNKLDDLEKRENFLTQKINSLRSTLEDKSREKEKLLKHNKELEHNIKRCEDTIKTIKTDLKTILKDITAVENEMLVLRQEYGEFKEKKEKYEMQRNIITTEVETIHKRIDSLRMEKKNSVEILNKIVIKAKDFKKNIASITSEIEKLETLLKKIIGGKRILEQKLTDVESEIKMVERKLSGEDRIINYVDFPDGMGRVLDVIFWDVMDLPVRKIKDFDLKDMQDGFVIKKEYGESFKIENIKVKEGAPMLILNRLKQWKIVDDFKKALRIVEEDNISCVLPCGIGIHRDGFVIVSQEGKFEKKEYLGFLNKKRKRIQRGLCNLQNRLKEIENLLSEMKLEKDELEKKFFTLEAEKNKIEKNVEFISKEEKLLLQKSEELKQKLKEIEDFDQEYLRLKEIEKRIKELERKKEMLESKKRLQEELLQKHTAELNSLLRSASEILGNVGGINTSISILQDELKNVEQEVKFIACEKERVKEEIVCLEKDIEHLKNILKGKEESIKILEAERPDFDDHAHEIEKLKKEYNLLEENFMKIEKKLQDVTEKVLMLQKEVEGFREEGAEVVEKIRVPFKKAEAALKKIGVVNPEIAERYEEEKKNFEEYKKHYHDIKEASVRLRTMIKEIDIDAKRMFNEVFVKVRENYKRLFSFFFDGGFGDLVIKDPQNPLESEIEILAKPAGKELKKLQQLSDGEKTMLGITLLFSLYEVVPSKFLLIDELDAPLDDANVVKFVKYLKKLSNYTQVILITHNKRTIEYADYLYGVTMENPGISKVVSLNLVKAKEVVDAT